MQAITLLPLPMIKSGKRIGNLFLKGQEGNEDASGNRGMTSTYQETKERVASEGGKAAHEQVIAHEWDSEEAKEAGKKGRENCAFFEHETWSLPRLIYHGPLIPKSLLLQRKINCQQLTGSIAKFTFNTLFWQTC